MGGGGLSNFDWFCLVWSSALYDSLDCDYTEITL